MQDIVMPRLSDSMEEGTILSWLKSEGDEVAVGDELVEIETDKANMVYEADAAGTLIEVVAEEGATLAIGEVIARVGEAGEKPAGGDGAEPEAEEEEAEAEGAESEEAGAEETEAEDAREEATEPEAEDAEQEDEGAEKPEAEAEQEDEGAEEPEGEDAEQEDEGAEEPEGEEGAEPEADGGAEPSAEPESAPKAPAATAERPSPAEAAPVQAGDGRVKASPLARRIARERGLDLSQLEGTGPGGRIVKADVERVKETAATAAAAGEAVPPAVPEAPPAAPTAGAAEKPETARGGVETVELTKLQQTVARRMAESKATAPHFYLSAEIDMTGAVAARERLKAAAREGDVVPSLNDVVIKACAIALTEFPRANGAYRDGNLELYSRVNVGVAVAARDALVVPTIFDADRKGLRQIATEARALAQRVREGTVTPPELSGGTFTVSNLGMFGIQNFSAVINPPQAAILAVGEVAERPVAREGEITTARLMGVTLACDHRILYGADGAQFLARVRDLLSEPLALAL